MWVFKLPTLNLNEHQTQKITNNVIPSIESNIAKLYISCKTKRVPIKWGARVSPDSRAASQFHPQGTPSLSLSSTAQFHLLAPRRRLPVTYFICGASLHPLKPSTRGKPGAARLKISLSHGLYFTKCGLEVVEQWTVRFNVGTCQYTPTHLSTWMQSGYT